MKRLMTLIATIAFVLAAPFAGAAVTQFELLPDGTQGASIYPPQVDDERSDRQSAEEIDSPTRFFNRGTGGVPAN